MEEEIKMIVEAVQSLSGNAFWAFIVYLVVGKLLYVALCWTGGIVLVFIVTKTVARIIYNTYYPTAAFKEIRAALNLGTDGYLYESEIEKIRGLLPDMIVAYKKSKEK